MGFIMTSFKPTHNIVRGHVPKPYLRTFYLDPDLILDTELSNYKIYDLVCVSVVPQTQALSSKLTPTISTTAWTNVRLASDRTVLNLYPHHSQFYMGTCLGLCLSEANALLQQIAFSESCSPCNGKQGVIQGHAKEGTQDLYTHIVTTMKVLDL